MSLPKSDQPTGLDVVELGLASVVHAGNEDTNAERSASTLLGELLDVVAHKFSDIIDRRIIGKVELVEHLIGRTALVRHKQRRILIARLGADA